MFVICPFLCLDCDWDVPASPPASVSISLSLLSVLGLFLATPILCVWLWSFCLPGFPRPSPPSVVSLPPPTPSVLSPPSSSAYQPIVTDYLNILEKYSYRQDSPSGTLRYMFLFYNSNTISCPILAIGSACVSWPLVCSYHCEKISQVSNMDDFSGHVSE